MRLSLIFFSAVIAFGASVDGSVEIVNGSSHSASDVVVWLQPLSGSVPEMRKPVHRTLLQKDKSFRPHVLAIRAGTVVDFPNADPIFHNAFSNYDGQVFDVSLYPPGTSRSVQFQKPGIVRVFCNIHPMMSAVIVVLDTPYFTTAARDGRFHIAGVEPGEYNLMTFDERAVSEGHPPRHVHVGDADVTVDAVQISELRYVPMKHRNKYGEDYPPASESYGDVPR